MESRKPWAGPAAGRLDEGMHSKALVAEFVGTFALIFIGAGAGAISGSLPAVAFAHGLVVLGFAYAYGHISSTHINPAVTIGLPAGGQIQIGNSIGYIVAQCIGGIAAAALYRGLKDK